MVLKDTSQSVTFQVDTGATVNLLPLRYAIQSNIRPTVKKLKMWNDTHVNPVGVCRIVIQNPKNQKKYSVEFVIVKENLAPLLGLRAAQSKKLVTVNETAIERITSVSPCADGKLLPSRISLMCLTET